MIVPFGMIPQQFLAPLNVETKMEYKINKRKFPGLKEKSAHPALLIATKCEDSSPGHQQDAPIDLSQTGRRKAPVRCLNSTDSRQRLAEKRPTSRAGLRPNRSGTGGHSLSSGKHFHSLFTVNTLTYYPESSTFPPILQSFCHSEHSLVFSALRILTNVKIITFWTIAILFTTEKTDRICFRSDQYYNSCIAFFTCF